MMEMMSLSDTYFTKTKEELSEAYKKELAEKIHSILIKVGEKPLFKDTRAQVLEIFDYLSDSVKDGVSRDIQNDFRDLYYQALNLIQRFAPTNKVFLTDKKFWALKNTLAKDENAKKFFTDFRAWADGIINNPQKAKDEGITNGGVELINRSLEIREKYGDRLKSILEEFKSLLKSMQDQKYITEYREGIKQVGNAFNGSGSILDVVSQLRMLVIPVFKEIMKEIPLQRMEENDPSNSWSVENMVLMGRELNLDDVSFQLKFGMKNFMKAIVKIKNVEATVRNVNFKFDRTSIPAWTDEGILDCTIAAPFWKLKWSVCEETGRAPYFELIEVNGSIRKLDVTLIEARHTLLDRILLPALIPVFRRRAQQGIEQILRKNAENLTKRFNQFFSTKGSTLMQQYSDFKNSSDQESYQKDSSSSSSSTSGVSSGKTSTTPATKATNESKNL